MLLDSPSFLVSETNSICKKILHIGYPLSIMCKQLYKEPKDCGVLRLAHTQFLKRHNLSEV